MCVLAHSCMKYSWTPWLGDDLMPRRWRMHKGVWRGACHWLEGHGAAASLPAPVDWKIVESPARFHSTPLRSAPMLRPEQSDLFVGLFPNKLIVDARLLQREVWGRSLSARPLACLSVTAVVWFGLVLKILIHVYVVLTVGGFTGCQGAGLHLDGEGTLDDRNGRLWAARDTGAVWRYVRWGRGFWYGDITWIYRTCTWVHR